MSFANQIVLITGASKGIGRCLALDFARLGAVVVGCGRSREGLDRTLEEVRPFSPSSLMIPCDVGRRDQVQDMLGKILAQFGRVDILINNAGIGMRRPFVETPLDTVEAIMQTNYMGMVYCTHGVLPSMIARRSGHIVNVSSGAGIIGTLNMAGYCASKFAMNGFSESLDQELSALGIHVSVICPGPVSTEFNQAFADMPPKSPRQLFMSPEAVSRKTIEAIENKRFEAVMPGWLGWVVRFKRLTPGLFRRLANRVFRKRSRPRGGTEHSV